MWEFTRSAVGAAVGGVVAKQDEQHTIPYY